MNITEKAKTLFQRSYNLNQEIILLQESLKDIKNEFEYHKEFNTNGLPKEDVKRIMKASAAKAKSDDLKGKSAELLEIDQLISELE